MSGTPVVLRPCIPSGVEGVLSVCASVEGVVRLCATPAPGDYVEALGKTWLVTRRLVREGDVKVWLVEAEGP
jgi:hypothetical protein